MQCRCSAVQPTTWQCANAIDVLEEGGGWRCMRVDCMKRARELFLLLRRCRNVVDEKWQRRGEFVEDAGQTDIGEISFECKTKRRGSSLTIGGSCVDTRAHPPRFCSALSSFRCPSPETRFFAALFMVLTVREAYRESGEIKGDSEI
ncbi:hypothetical protein G5I_00883 [Acromyrmex echinatior]|uniref:Uncharacterized protein n=1 Tax=Acromyrmex echinatior TaxID=103372 RepID=F4W6Q0_ACREC|nr:hypothetical protein G5I_00883 [Acromyrmex echinatior]